MHTNIPFLSPITCFISSNTITGLLLAKASRMTGHPVVTSNNIVANYAALSIGQDYPVPLDFSEANTEIEFTDLFKVKIKRIRKINGRIL